MFVVSLSNHGPTRQIRLKALPYRLFPITFVVLAVALAYLVAVSAPSAHANGRVLRYQTQAAGPYDISLGTIPETPTVGPLHLSVTVTVRSEGGTTPVLDAVVTVEASGPDAAEPEIGPTELANNPIDLSFYETNIEVDRVGTWSFDFDVDSAHGPARARFEVTVQESSPIVGLLTLFVLVALLFVLGLAVRSYLRQRYPRLKDHDPR